MALNFSNLPKQLQQKKQKLPHHLQQPEQRRLQIASWWLSTNRAPSHSFRLSSPTRHSRLIVSTEAITPPTDTTGSPLRHRAQKRSANVGPRTVANHDSSGCRSRSRTRERRCRVGRWMFGPRILFSVCALIGSSGFHLHRPSSASTEYRGVDGGGQEAMSVVCTLCACGSVPPLMSVCVCGGSSASTCVTFPPTSPFPAFTAADKLRIRRKKWTRREKGRKRQPNLPAALLIEPALHFKKRPVASETG